MKVSVIVPIYNVERYIEECLISLINQRFDDYEIILVNDGSNDDSISIANNYLSKFSNIKLINKENGGLSSARNYGLKYAIGEYICFVDSDDIVTDEYIYNLYNKAKENEVDIVLASHKKIWENGLIKDVKRETFNENEILSGKEVLLKQLRKKDFMAEVWDDIYRREFLEKNNITFYEGIYHEDEEFTFKALLVAEKVGFLKSYDYLYRQRENSIMSSTKIEKRVADILTIIQTLQERYNQCKGRSEKELIYIRTLNLLNTITDLIKDENKNSYYFELVKSKIDLKLWRKNKYSLKSYIQAIMISTNYKLYISIYRFMK